MKLSISTNLNIPIKTVWEYLETPKLLLYVTNPLVQFTPINPSDLPKIWEEKKYLVRTKFLKLVPLGKQYIVITKDPNGTWLRDNGFGDLAQKWDHLITLESIDTNTTKYTDTVEIKAGILTLGVWIFASIFYRFRQLQWRKLATNKEIQIQIASA